MSNSHGLPHGLPPAGQPAQQPSPRKHRGLSRRTRTILRRSLIGLLITVLVLSIAGVGAAFWLQRHYDDNIERFRDPFADLPPSSRPRGAVGAMNVLLLGSDSRISADDEDQWLRGAQRTDAIMLAHVPADRSAVNIAALPKDAVVPIDGHGRGPLSDAFRLGGPTLMIKTVEAQTGVRINHLVILDFEGFRDITDDLHGVDVAQRNGATVTMDGDAALRYVRQSRSIPGQDEEEVRRQQAWIRAVSTKALAKNTVTSPLTVTSVLDSLTRSISADEGFSIEEMRSLTLSLRKVNGDRMQFITPPTGARGSLFWTAMATDRLPAYLSAHPNTPVH